MSEYTATVVWARLPADDFLAGRYSRRHRWCFDGGLEVTASSSPHIVPLPMSDPSAVDPEEAFVASLSSCHMLFFLAVAAHRGFAIERYLDEASGTLQPDAEGRLAMTRVTLRPVVTFDPDHHPAQDELETMHHRAHEQCFIANSVRSDVRIVAQRM